ncbi:Hcp family type VI secretion system effector [Escherichia coli]|uniref:Hcp family type VI secretion system effector n=1 Tax=Enterobacteriaceae TaxID=543 RepID=UPI000BE61B0D|nr:Hcp family type VI secretion system effector [Escherichia coli]EJV7410971.1 Hcp family type VI secretion system effector [Escherichia coli]MDB7232263.1 Hcp family type VI secretion system effector [Escherichia coli]
MANISYLSLSGETQGLISAGCSTLDSVGNKAQPEHKDQIMVYALMHSISRSQNVNHHELIITKPVDKSSPLLAKALSDNEKMAICEFILYRTSKAGIYQPYYKINLSKARISSIDFVTPHAVLEKELEPQERIAFIYEDISWEHTLAGTNAMSKWQDRAQ